MDNIESVRGADSHERSDHLRTRSALVVSVLAMVLAITSLGGSNATKEAMHANIMASNTYAFYQAKNIRQTDYKLAAEALELELLSGAALPSAARERMSKTFEDYKKNIARYESEPDTGEGKKELLARAREHEKVRDLALRRDPWFDYGEGLLQIAIVLASVAIITNVPGLLWGAIVLGLSGSACALNGFVLLV